MSTNNKQKINLKENLRSGYFFVIIFSVLAFLSFYLLSLKQLYAGNIHIYNKDNSYSYIFALCLFAVSFILSCVIVSFIPKKLTNFISSKQLPTTIQTIILAVSVGVFIFLLLNCLLVSEVNNPPYRINYATVFYWRQMPLAFVIVLNGVCITFVLYLAWKNLDSKKVTVYLTYTVAVILIFMHNLYLNNFDRYHHAAAYDPVYNCYNGIPFDRFTTGIYGHYGIFIAALLRLLHGDAITMFYIHAIITALEMCLYLYIIHNCVQKNFIRIISAFAGIFCIGVLAVYMHWQSVPIRNLSLLVITAYMAWICKHQKLGNNKYIYIILGYVLAALGIVWNTESGIFASLAFTAAIIIYYWKQYKWYEKKMLIIYLKLIGLFIMSIVFALGFVNVYNLICGGKIIFKAFFYPYFESAYMDAWGENSGINVSIGNHTWMYSLICFALLLFLGIYYTKLINSGKENFDTLAPVYVCNAICGFTMYSYYASRPVYLSLDIVFYFICISLAIFADKFILNISNVVKTRNTFLKIGCKSLGCISTIMLTIFAVQIIFTTPNLLNKAQKKMWVSNEFKLQASLIDKVLPINAMYIGTGSCDFKLQLKKKSPYYYRHIDMFAPGYEYCDKLIEEAKQCDYVLFSLITREDRAALERFTEQSPEYTLVSLNKIGGVEYKLYSKLDKYECTFLACSLPANGECEFNADKIILKSGASQFGPYIDLKPGNYSVKIDGDGLDSSEYDVLSNASSNIQVTEISRSDTEIQYKFTLNEAANIEFRTMNNSDSEVILNEIQLSACIA